LDFRIVLISQKYDPERILGIFGWFLKNGLDTLPGRAYLVGAAQNGRLFFFFEQKSQNPKRPAFIIMNKKTNKIARWHEIASKQIIFLE